MTHKLLIMIIFALVNVANSHSNNNVPITTPIKFEAADTLSKYYHVSKITKLDKSSKDKLLFDHFITDPRVTFSSYFGGNGYDCVYGVAVDKSGFVYFTGYTGSTDLPMSQDAYQKEKKGGHDAFVSKFDEEGHAVWLSYFGGSSTDVAVDCIVDKDGNFIITGKTNSPDFPVTDSSKYKKSSDVFISKFNPDGNLLWSKLLGGKDFDAPEAIENTPDGGFVIAGYTISPDLPVTEGAFQDSLSLFSRTYIQPDAFVAKFDSDANLIWLTYLGGIEADEAHGVSVNKEGDIAVTGEAKFANYKGYRHFPVTDDAYFKDSVGLEDVFLSVFTPDGQLKYSTIFGGKSSDYAYDVKYDHDGNICFTGTTWSQDYPVTNDAFSKTLGYQGDIILTKFDSRYKLLWSTYIGGDSIPDNKWPRGEVAYGMDIDIDNNIWITGFTNGGNYPLTNDYIFKNEFPFDVTMVVSRFTPVGQLSWSSMYGEGTFGYKIKAVSANKFLIGGETRGPIPVTKGAFQELASLTPSEYEGILLSFDLSHTDVIENAGNKDALIINVNEQDHILTVISVLNDPIASLKITDLFGRQVYQNNNIESKQIYIPLKELSLSHSIYFITVTTSVRTVICKFIY